MVELSVAEAARRLGISEQRTRDMVRRNDLRGRRIGSRTWLVDAASVRDRAQVDVGRGRPWSVHTIDAIITALSDGERVDAKSAARLRDTDVEQLWRKIAQRITVRRYATRDTDLVREYLALTGESALERIGEHLVGQSRVLHGYLRGIDLEDLIEDAGLIEDGEGNVAIHEHSGIHTASRDPALARRALIAVDSARSSAIRVHSAGIRALAEMKQSWLAKNT